MAESREYQSVGAVVQEVDPPKQYQTTYAVVDSTAEEEAGGGGTSRVRPNRLPMLGVH